MTEMESVDCALPPMVMHHLSGNSADQPAGRSEFYGVAGAASAGDAEIDGDDGASKSHDRQRPLLPSIKESMPFLKSLTDVKTSKEREAGAGLGGDLAAKREPVPGLALQPTPPFGCSDHEKGGSSSLPPLCAASATPSLAPSQNVSPSVSPQSPPTRDPTKADLNGFKVIESSPSPECEIPERVGGLAWGERRKKIKFEQTFQSACPRSQRVAHLKLAIAKLIEALPLEEKSRFLSSLQRYLAGEVSPEDLAEGLKGLIDTHNIIVPLDCPAAGKPADERAPSLQSASGDAPFMKPGKRGSGAVGKGPLKDKGKVAKIAKAKAPPQAPASRKAAVSANSGRSLKKRKHSDSAASSDEEEVLQKPQPKKSAGGTGTGASWASGAGKVLHGALTPAVANNAHLELQEEENSAWDALLSVCAQMPRQKSHK